GGQPVTAVDVEADRYLREVLGGARPAYGWISEESDPRTWRSGERVWIVDPLDGTGNFVAGSPEFAVSIGLVERGTPVVGVVYYPVADRMYHALRGGGAFRDGSPLGASPGTTARPRLVASPSELAADEIARVPGWEVEVL